MILINIAVFIALIGLGVFSYGVNQRDSVHNHDSIIEIDLTKKTIPESNVSVNESKEQQILEDSDEKSTKNDELLKAKQVLEEEISTYKIELAKISNQNQTLNSMINALNLEKESLKNDVSSLELQISKIQEKNEENLVKINQTKNLPDKEKEEKKFTKLLEESEKLKTIIKKQDEKIILLNDQLSKISNNKEFDQAKSKQTIEKSKLESLTVELEKLQKKVLDNMTDRLAFEKRIQSQKNKILDISTVNLELKKNLEVLEKKQIESPLYKGMVATFTGNLVYEPKKKKIILLSPEGIEFIILQDDFPGDLVAKCGLPVSSSSKDRCVVTISAQVLVEEGQLILKGKEIKDIRKK